MKTAEEFAEELREMEETGLLHSMYERVSRPSLTHQEAIEAIEFRDAEIHALYAPMVEALRNLYCECLTGPSDDGSTWDAVVGQAKSTLAAIKEVKG